MINHSDEAVRLSVATAGVTLWGITLNEWVAMATIFYLVLQIFVLMPKAIAIIKRWFHGRAE